MTDDLAMSSRYLKQQMKKIWRLVVLENVLVVSSGLRDFDWSRVALERWQCWSGMIR